MEISKYDWKLFREKLPNWQESCMARLNQKYIEILTGDGKPSDKFWSLEKCIRQDKRSPDVIIQMRKQDLTINLISLINDGVIALHDIEEFSDTVKETVRHFCNTDE